MAGSSPRKPPVVKRATAAVPKPASPPAGIVVQGTTPRSPRARTRILQTKQVEEVVFSSARTTEAPPVGRVTGAAPSTESVLRAQLKAAQEAAVAAAGFVRVSVNGVLIGAFRTVDFLGPGLGPVAPSPQDPSQVDIDIAGTGSSAALVAAGLDTSSVTSGRFCYVSGDNTVLHTDAGSYPKALSLGVFAGVAGQVVRHGQVLVEFSATSATPAAGDPIFLAHADAEPPFFAAGKVTTMPPSAGFVSPVGGVLAFDSFLFAASRRVLCTVQVLPVTRRAP